VGNELNEIFMFDAPSKGKKKEVSL